MKFRWRFVARRVTATAALTLSWCASITMLLAQAPSAPTQSEISLAQSPAAASAPANAKLTFKITDAPHHTYGYDVFADGRLMIHQTSAPALPGNEGFKTPENATKVALLVIEKIRKGEMPPTISIDEMKKLSVLNISLQ